MRSLRYLRLDDALSIDELPITATTWDPASNSVICTFGPTPDHPVVSLKRRHSAPAPPDVGTPGFDPIASWDALCPLPNLPCDAIVSLHYFADNFSACIILAGGDIIVVHEDPQPGEDKIEIVGSVDAGITAAAWSPDEELLVLTTRAGTLLYMTREYDNIANVSFNIDDLKASKHVSVGWGRAETQFKGKRAKALRDPTIPETVDEGRLSDNDNRRLNISWRGDGNFVAVNSIEDESRRVIRVYSREGTLDSVSEPVDGLTGALSWRPAGNLIAGVQRLEERIDVVFFERNGLRHGQFPLRLSKEDMRTWASDIELHWNISSSVLVVCFRDRVQLWTMGNYHYYLKQELPVPVKGAFDGPIICKWHPEKELRVSIASRGSFWIRHGPIVVGAVADLT
jgi:elongator complex protein 1